MTRQRPIFILSHPRTGSTLLRYLIDAHPDVCCPSEIALGKLCAALSYTIGLTLNDARVRDAGGDRKAAIRAEVRRHVDAIMDAYCAARNKPRWCDKSTHNVEFLRQLPLFFPDAQYVSLHRECTDVVYSMLEAYRYGFPGKVGERVARYSSNFIEALMLEWHDSTSALLQFEDAHRGCCLRMTYERLVGEPASTVARLCGFLELREVPSLVRDAFTTPKDAGPGDPKIRFTSRVMATRVGKGATLPLDRVSVECLDKVNALNRQLGYAELVRAGDGSAPPVRPIFA
ncbi:MAG: sulfotransferase family protein [Vicinamibacterales bacterium]